MFARRLAVIGTIACAIVASCSPSLSDTLPASPAAVAATASATPSTAPTSPATTAPAATAAPTSAAPAPTSAAPSPTAAPAATPLPATAAPVAPPQAPAPTVAPTISVAPATPSPTPAGPQFFAYPSTYSGIATADVTARLYFTGFKDGDQILFVDTIDPNGTTGSATSQTYTFKGPTYVLGFTWTKGARAGTWTIRVKAAGTIYATKVTLNP